VGALTRWHSRQRPDRRRIVVGVARRLLALDPAKEARLVLPHVPAAGEDRAVLDPDNLLVHECAVPLPDRLQQRLAPAGVPAVPRRVGRDGQLDRPPDEAVVQRLALRRVVPVLVAVAPVFVLVWLVPLVRVVGAVV